MKHLTVTNFFALAKEYFAAEDLAKPKNLLTAFLDLLVEERKTFSDLTEYDQKNIYNNLYNIILTNELNTLDRTIEEKELFLKTVDSYFQSANFFIEDAPTTMKSMYTACCHLAIKKALYSFKRDKNGDAVQNAFDSFYSKIPLPQLQGSVKQRFQSIMADAYFNALLTFPLELPEAIVVALLKIAEKSINQLLILLNSFKKHPNEFESAKEKINAFLLNIILFKGSFYNDSAWCGLSVFGQFAYTNAQTLLTEDLRYLLSLFYNKNFKESVDLNLPIFDFPCPLPLEEKRTISTTLIGKLLFIDHPIASTQLIEIHKLTKELYKDEIDTWVNNGLLIYEKLIENSSNEKEKFIFSILNDLSPTDFGSYKFYLLFLEIVTAHVKNEKNLDPIFDHMHSFFIKLAKKQINTDCIKDVLLQIGLKLNSLITIATLYSQAKYYTAGRWHQFLLRENVISPQVLSKDLLEKMHKAKIAFSEKTKMIENANPEEL